MSEHASLHRRGHAKRLVNAPEVARTADRFTGCKRDEGRPLGAGDQAQASNHCELLPLRAVVVSVAGKGGR